MQNHDFKAGRADFDQHNRTAKSPFETFKSKPEFMGVVLLIVIVMPVDRSMLPVSSTMHCAMVRMIRGVLVENSV